MTTDQFVSWLVGNEWDDRRNRTIERAVKGAAFRYKASVEDLDYSIERGLDKNQVQRFAELSFVAEHKDLFITGSAGTGKSIWPPPCGIKPVKRGIRFFMPIQVDFWAALRLQRPRGPYCKN